MPAPLPRRAAILGAAAALAASPPRIRLRTPLGDILIGLHLTRAPLTAGDFLKYVHAGAYTGGRIFRTVRPDNDRGDPKIDVIQGEANPNAPQWAPIPHESTAQTGLRHIDGAVSLPRDAPGTGSGRAFFICIGAQPALDFGGHRNKDAQGFAVFGQVLHGMDIVRRIWAQPASGVSQDAYTRGQILTQPIEILRASGS